MSLRKTLAFVAIATLLTACVAASAETEIRLKTRTFDPAPIGDVVRALADHAGSHAMIQLYRTPTATDREAMAADGVTLLAPLSGSVWLARVEDRATYGPRALRAVRWLGAIPATDKLSTDLQARTLYPFAVHEDGQPVFSVEFFKDVTAETGRALIEQAGGEVVDYDRYTNAFVAAMTTESAVALADSDLVLAVSQPGPALTPLLDEVRPAVGADVASEEPYLATGAGITVFILDGGTIATDPNSHPDLAGRVTVAGLPVPDFIGHPTHVGCITAGTGYMSDGLYMGMAPAAGIVSSSIIPGLNLPPMYDTPGNMAGAYDVAMDQYGATVSNNSIGSNLAQFGTRFCDMEGDYEETARTVDGIALANAHRLTIVWANGNERGYADGGCGDKYNTTAPPATAKNSIAVGATNKENDAMTSFSSWGPTDDGRVRPDLSAPGCSKNGVSIISCTGPLQDGDYMGMCGTSMASPAVAGSVALIQEYWKRLKGTAPRGDTTKALAIHGTAPAGDGDGPDYEYGYGVIDVPASLDAIDNAIIVEGYVEQGQEYRLALDPTDAQARVTLVWFDPPGERLAARTLVNDLDLSVVTEEGTVLPWVLDPAVPDQPAVRGENHRDPVEQVEFNAGALTTGVEIVVRGTEVPLGPQAFSLVIDGLVEPADVGDDDDDDDDAGGDDSASDDDDDDDSGCGC